MKNVIPFSLLILLGTAAGIFCEHLSPPYFNVARKGKIVATATCGDEGVKEEYCQFTEKHGDVYTPPCGHYCDLSDPFLTTTAENAIDGSSLAWQSPPLSRGENTAKYSMVNVTVDLGQEFSVHYVLITMGNSPRPAVWSLERSVDFGQTWLPWRHFAPSQEECLEHFGITNSEVTTDNPIICDPSFSHLRPFQHGQINVSLLNDQPSANDYYKKRALHNWTKATNVRLRFIKTGIDLMNDTFLTPNPMSKFLKKYFFYSIMDMSITATCSCNGHADMCTVTSRETTCYCQHDTCGSHCEYCCSGHFRSSLNTTDKCEKCDCYWEGTKDGICDKSNGQCLCKNEFTGARCDKELPIYIIDEHDYSGGTNMHEKIDVVPKRLPQKNHF